MSQRPAGRPPGPRRLRTAVAGVLADGPLTVPRLGAALAIRFPEAPPAALGALARVATPLAQLLLRGVEGVGRGRVPVARPMAGGRAGGAGPGRDRPPLPAGVRPRTAADVTTWSGVTGLTPVLTVMDDLVVREDADGRRLYDLPGAELADETRPRRSGCSAATTTSGWRTPDGTG